MGEIDMSNFKVAMLASGSKGNAALIGTDSQRFLVDMGISCRALVNKLKEVDCQPQDLSGIFITHEHVDHVKGLVTFLKKYQIPVYSSEKTWRAILSKYSNLERRSLQIINSSVICGDMEIRSFPVPHDAVDPHGYVFTQRSTGERCTYLTDTGFPTDLAREAADGAQTLILEANHDLEMLKNGAYPYVLKQRILGTRGHLSNNSAGWLLTQLRRIPEHVILAHLSQENNLPSLALKTVQQSLMEVHRFEETRIVVASQERIVANYEAIQPSIFE